MSHGAPPGGALPSVVAVFGAADALREEEIGRLRSQVVAAGDDFNAHTFEGGEEGVRRALESLATLPLGAARRWVHLRGLERLAGGAAERLVAYLERPAAHAVLCLSGARLDMRTTFGRAVRRHVDVRATDPPTAAALPAWLVAWGRRHGAPMTGEAASLLVALVGQEPGQLCRAAEVAALFAHPATPLEAAHVAAAQATVAPARIFALGERVGARDGPAASGLLAQLLAEGQPPVLVLSLLTRHLEQLLITRTLPAADARRGGGLAARLGVPPGVAQRLERQAARWTPHALAAGLSRALAAEVALKSTSLAPRLVLGALLRDLTAF